MADRRFQTGARDPENDDPGLVLGDDDVTYLIAPDGTRSEVGGDGGGSPVTISETDPGAIGAGQMWLRLDPTQSWAPMLYVRNQADDGWEDQAGAGYLLGLTYYDDDGNVAATLSGSQYQMLMKAGANTLSLNVSNGLAALTGVDIAQLVVGSAYVSVEPDNNAIILKATSAPAGFYVTGGATHSLRRLLVGADGDFPLAADLAAIVIGPSNESTDANLSPGWCSFSYDDTDGAAKLKIKAKTADGNVVHGEIALT